MIATQRFWDWFSANHQAYLFLEGLTEKRKSDLLNDLLSRLHAYCNRIYFEIGGHPGEDVELIFTAEGDPDYFDKVEELVRGAPVINNWRFLAFIPPKGAAFRLNYEDVELNPEEMWFLPLPNPLRPDALGIRIGAANYELIKESRWLDPALYKMMDIMIGEKSFALDIDYVALEQLPDEPDALGMLKLSDLPAYISWRKQRVSGH